MDALMDRYATAFIAGDRLTALRCYEAFTYLVLWVGQDAPHLADLEATATPLMHEAAAAMGVPYLAPSARGQQVSWASIDALLASTPPGQTSA